MKALGINIVQFWIGTTLFYHKNITAKFERLIQLLICQLLKVVEIEGIFHSIGKNQSYFKLAYKVPDIWYQTFRFETEMSDSLIYKIIACKCLACYQ